MMTKLNRVVSLAAVAVIAVALAAGPAHARGGLKAETAELLLVDGVCDDFDAATENCDANANVSAVTAYESKRNPTATSTVWTMIAENLLAGPTYNLFNRDPDIDIVACQDQNFVADLTSWLKATGDILTPTTIITAPGEAMDTVDVCRAVTNEFDEIVDWVWILTGSFTGGASGGGKDNNRRNK